MFTLTIYFIALNVDIEFVLIYRPHPVLDTMIWSKRPSHATVRLTKPNKMAAMFLHVQTNDLVAGGGEGGEWGGGAPPQRDEGVEPVHAPLPQVQEQDRELPVGESLRLSLSSSPYIRFESGSGCMRTMLT